MPKSKSSSCSSPVALFILSDFHDLASSGAVIIDDVVGERMLGKLFSRSPCDVGEDRPPVALLLVLELACLRDTSGEEREEVDEGDSDVVPLALLIGGLLVMDGVIVERGVDDGVCLSGGG